MKAQKYIKSKLISYIQNLIHERIEQTQKALEQLQESKQNETKSSAGDKYETSREMIQLEENKLNAQLFQTLELQKDIADLDETKDFEQVAWGSLVFTNRGTYFICVGLGKVEFDDENYFLISLTSPIGKAFLHKKTGEKVSFQSKTFEIENIV